MKFLRIFPFIATLLLLGFSSCNEDIDYSGDFEETAIVYGLLNQADSIHYIKVTRAFGGSNNSIEVAQIADSSYFKYIDVVVDEVINNVVTRSWTLDDTLLLNKEEGVFYSPEQKVYYFKTATANPLVTTATYKLRATINNGEFIVKGETKLIEDMSITNPNINAAFTWGYTAATNVYNNSTVEINPGTSQILDSRIKVFFNEYFNGVPVEKSFTWKLGELSGSQIGATSASFYASGKTFFELMRDNVTNDPTITKRELSRIQLIVTGGSEDLNKYILLNKPSSGLAQNKPTFTNLSASDGRRVVGLFSARNTIIQEKPEWKPVLPYYRAIDGASIRELCTGGITGMLLFCSDHPNDILAGESYVCQ